ncbi:energy transducer TonB [Limobrevibacterium gyesilva]|uniref:Energy transducer TonB n=1 Tax=Limobrevibacterium gyesilva TaxID=2991712 RepID=A0AA42CF56_9PROT|nr:energy transducer TonB [Limobrevibacterium gyesilva]MCW3476838.1 energy transducer TonB [Limobrevibacterium gyesilva]
MKRGLLIATAGHVLVIAALMLASANFDRPAPPPDQAAEVEVIEGAGAPGGPVAQDGRDTPSPPAVPGPPAPAVAAPDQVNMPPRPAVPPPPDVPPDGDIAATPPNAVAPSMPAAPAAPPSVRLGANDANPQARILERDPHLRPAQAAGGNPPPPYPLEAARRGEQGTVTLRIHVGASGLATLVEVVKSSGSPRLDRAARDTIASRWRFKPAMRDGQAVADVFDMNVNFEMD